MSEDNQRVLFKEPRTSNGSTGGILGDWLRAWGWQLLVFFVSTIVIVTNLQSADRVNEANVQIIRQDLRELQALHNNERARLDPVYLQNTAAQLLLLTREVSGMAAKLDAVSKQVERLQR